MKKSKEPRDYSFLKEIKPLYVLNKKRSPDTIEYLVSTDDDWFIYVATRGKKTGDIKHASMIIRKDMPNWLSYQESQGWEIKKMYEEQIKDDEANN